MWCILISAQFVERPSFEDRRAQPFIGGRIDAQNVIESRGKVGRRCRAIGRWLVSRLITPNRSAIIKVQHAYYWSNDEVTFHSPSMPPSQQG